LALLDGISGIMVLPLDGSGLRLRDIDFTTHEVVVREGKGDKDRVTTMLPAAVVAKFRAQWRWKIGRATTPA
jgi:hypothetical protein